MVHHSNLYLLFDLLGLQKSISWNYATHVASTKFQASSKFTGSSPLSPILFYRVNISGQKIRLVLKKSQNISWSTRTWKADIETGHYNWREKLYPLISLTKFWICLWYWICEGTEYTMVTQCSDYVWICLNNFWISQIMAEYTRICLIMPEYAWICLNIYLNGFWVTCLHCNPCLLKFVVSYFNSLTPGVH